MLLLSPPMSMPPADLLPMPPLSVTSGGSVGAAAAPDSAGAAGRSAAAVADDAADRLLQQQFRPSSSKLSEMFKPLEERLSPEQRAALDAAGYRSPRTAAELRAALLRLAQQSPPAQADAAALLLPPLGLPLPAPGAADAAAGAIGGGLLAQPGLLGLGQSLLDLEALDAARPALQYRCAVLRCAWLAIEGSWCMPACLSAQPTP